MLEGIRNWVINICCTIFFITATEMILPDNSMKKYAKFVLGLILITVIMNPILKLFGGNFNSSAYTNEIFSEINGKNYESYLEKYKEENISNTLKTFKDNLKISCEKSLKGKFPSSKFQVTVDAEYNKENENYKLKALNILTNERNKDEIISFLKEELKIDKEYIHVFKQ